MRKIVSSINPVLSNKIMYFVLMKKRLNLRTPETLNEKINWLKLNVFPNDDLIIQCANKYGVRQYLETKSCSKYLNEILFSWENVSQIEWDALPMQFVLKCNHGCGYNIICADRNQFNNRGAARLLNKWMNENFGKVSGEPHYSKIPRRIICEKYLADDIKDYKFFCFNGEPKFFYISQNVKGNFHNMKADFFTVNGRLADFKRTDHKSFDELPEMPQQLPEMLDLARKLSEDFAFVRVDLFNIDGRIYFSELTFTPCSGMMPLSPKGADRKLGQLLDLSKFQ